MADLNLPRQGVIKLSQRTAASVPTPASGSVAVFLDDTGAIANKSSSGAVNRSLQINVLASDVVNSDATANTIADVTGLSFAVTANQRYKFKFVIPFTTAASTTGSRWAINGPALTSLNMRSVYSLTATTITTNEVTAYDTPAAANASALLAGSLATMEGIIVPSANGTVIARFASKVSSSAITAKAGAYVEWQAI